MKRLTFAALAVLALGVIQPATAADLYATNFNTPLYANGALIGQDGWLITGTSVVNPIMVANNPANGNVPLTTTGQDVRRFFDGGATITSGSVFYEADINVSAAQATGDYALHLSDGGTTALVGRAYIRSVGGATFAMALGTSSGAVTYGPEALPFGVPLRILVRYDLNSGVSNDSGALYVNPITPDGSGDLPYVAATLTGTDAVLISAVALRQGTATNAPTLTVDNYRAFTTTPVPEPALALLAVGMLAFVRRRVL